MKKDDVRGQGRAGVVELVPTWLFLVVIVLAMTAWVLDSLWS